MRGWKSSLAWEGIPFLLLLSIFGLISAVDWDYEKKLLISRTDAPNLSWMEAHMGPVMLGFAFILAFIASGILFIARLGQPKINRSWYLILCLVPVAIFFIFPSLYVIILGPATITMMENMSQAR